MPMAHFHVPLRSKISRATDKKNMCGSLGTAGRSETSTFKFPLNLMRTEKINNTIYREIQGKNDRGGWKSPSKLAPPEFLVLFYY